jgi:Tfp pilus assembly protein PilN
MIKVNLIGSGRKKQAKAGFKINMPASFTPVLLILIALVSAGVGYWWYSNLTQQAADLDQQIQGLEARRAALEAVIKADQIFEARKKVLENRVRIIESLAKNQVSPVLALDQLAEAVERTRYVWLSNLDQRDAILNMSGVGTSLSAIADFYSNLYATGFFKNIDLGPSQESSGNFTFSLKCEFAPPRSAVSNEPPKTAAAGGN